MSTTVTTTTTTSSLHRLRELQKKFRINHVLATGSGEVRHGTLYLKQRTATDGSYFGGGGSNTNEKLKKIVSHSTPMYFIHSQTGSIPHVTAEVLKQIYPTAVSSSDESSCGIPPVQISLDSTLKFADALKKFEEGVGPFVGLPEPIIFLTIHDPLYPLRSGHNDKFGIALWSRHGRTSLTPEKFTELVDVFKPSISQIMSDYDVRPGVSGMKRVRKSLARAEEYTGHVFEHPSELEGDEKCEGFFVTIEAAWFEVDKWPHKEAKATVQRLLEKQNQIGGFVIAGITDRFKIPHVKSKSSEKSSSDDKSLSGVSGAEKSSKNPNDKRSTEESDRMNICENLESGTLDLLKSIVKLLPKCLPIYVPGPFTLSQMVDLMSCGVDLFDSSVTSRMADDGDVFILDKVEEILPSCYSPKIRSSLGEDLPQRNSDRDSSVESGTDKSEYVDDSPPVVSLKEKRFFNDFGPISKICSCYTCRKHTRSYLHHLYATDELLGPVLVQIHNLTSLDRFFNIVQLIIKDSTLSSSRSTESMLDKVKTFLKTKAESESGTEDEDDSNEDNRTETGVPAAKPSVIKKV